MAKSSNFVSKDSNNIKKIMSKLRTPKTINYLCKLIGRDEIETRELISKIRKHHPIFAYRDGRGYKYASKKEAKKMIKFERKLIRNHQRNLKVLIDYVGE